jgi:penicillin-binding protein 1C
VVATDGAAAEPAASTASRIVSARAAFWVADVLADPAARAWAFGSGGSLDFPFPVAVKTGTSQSYRDNWTIGFTRDLTVGVWVGNFDRRELRNSSGVTGAAPIFHDVMLAAQRHVAGRLPSAADAVAVPTEGLAPVTVCALSGRPATRACPSVETEWLPADAVGASCTWHVHEQDRVVVRYPARFRAWAREAGLIEEAGRAGPAEAAVPIVGARPRVADRLQILSPPAGAVYLRDPTLRDEYQTLPLRATGATSAALRWEVDGTPVGEAPAHATLDWPLRAGTHTIVVSGDDGQSDSATITVR